MKGGSTVEHDRMALRNLLEDVPNFGSLALDELLGTTHSVDVTKLLETADNEWLEKN